MIKVLFILLGLVFLLIILGILFFASYIILNKKENKPKEIIIKGSGNKRALIIYQKSKHGAITKVTMDIADILKSKGYSVTINHPSSKINYNLSDYEYVLLGSPVYIGSVSDPLTKYIENNSFIGKKVLLYLIGSLTDVDTEIKMLESKIKDFALLDAIKVKSSEEDRVKSFIETNLNK
jgi:flavorubredoxin